MLGGGDCGGCGGCRWVVRIWGLKKRCVVSVSEWWGGGFKCRLLVWLVQLRFACVLVGLCLEFKF